MEGNIRTSPDQNASVLRALRVIDALAIHGPNNLAQLTELTGLSRSATHRILSALVSDGRVRLRIADRHYQLTHNIVRLFEGSSYFSNCAEDLFTLITNVIGDRPVTFVLALGNFDTPIRIVEATEPRVDLSTPIDVMKDDIALTALAKVDYASLTRVFKINLNDLDDLNEVVDGNLTLREKFATIRRNGIVEPRVRQAILPFKTPEDSFGAVHIKGARTMSEADLADVIVALQKRLDAISACGSSPHS